MPSMRLNTTSKAEKSTGDGWQTVKSKADIAKEEAAHKKKQNQAISQAKAKAPTPAPAEQVTKAPKSKGNNGSLKPAIPGGSLVLAAFDQQWQEQQDYKRRGGGQDFQDANVYDALQTESKAAEATGSPADSATDSPKQREVKQKQQKAKKEKVKAEKVKSQPKAAASKTRGTASAPKQVTVTSLAAEVDVDGFKEFIATMVSKHPSDELLQIQLVQDFLRSVFATASLPHTTLLATNPLDRVADTPWLDLPSPIRQALTRFVGGKSSETLSTYLAQAVELLVTGMPERGSGGPPAKIEVLIMVAAVLRQKPVAAVLPTCDTLAKMGSRILAPGRMPSFLWVLEQAGRAGSGNGGEGTAVHAWCRVVLPGLVLNDIACLGTKKTGKGAPYQIEGTARTAAVDFIQRHLRTSANPESPLMQTSRAGLVSAKAAQAQPVVPAAAVEQVDAVVCGDVNRPVPRDSVAALEGIADQLRNVSLACAVPAHLDNMVSRVLESASSSSTSGVERQTDTMVQLMARHPVAGPPAWGLRHKSLIKGSARILEHMAGSRSSLAPLLAIPDGHSVLLSILSDIEARQATLLRSVKPSAARACAQRTATAAESLTASNTVHGVGGSALMSLVVILGACSVAVHFVATNPEKTQSTLEGVLGSDMTHAVVHFCQETVACMTTHVPAVAQEWSDKLGKMMADFSASSKSA